MLVTEAGIEMLINLGNSLNDSLPMLVIAGPNITVLKFGKALQTVSRIASAALNVTLVNGVKLHFNTLRFKHLELFITIVRTLLFPANTLLLLNVATEAGIVILDKSQL